MAYIDLETGLMKVAITGGAPSLIMPGLYTQVAGITWGEGDTFVFTPDRQSGLWTVSADGGEPTELTTLADGETSHRLPKVAARRSSSALHGIDGTTESRRRSDRRLLVRRRHHDNPAPRHTSSVRSDRAPGLRSRQPDPGRWVRRGPPRNDWNTRPVVENVLRRKGGVAQFSFSDNGLMMYVPADVVEPQHRLVWVDRLGRTEPVRDVAFGPHVKPRLSPEGNRIASFFVGYSAFDIWVYDLVTGNLQPVTLDGYRSSNMLPLWTPDGAGLTFERVGPMEEIFTRCVWMSPARCWH